MENKSNQGFLEKVSHLSENRTDVKTKVVAGIITLMITAYILAVNPNTLSAAGMGRGAVLTATALASLAATLPVATSTNYPFALALGMGLSVHFAHTIALQMGYTWQMALAAVFVEGLIFIMLSLTSVCEAIFDAILVNLKHAVPAGIGLFIASIGLWDARTAAESVTLVSVSPFKGFLEAGTFNSIGITVPLALVGVFITGTLTVKNMKGNIPWGILTTWTLGIICEVTGLYQLDAELGILSVLPDLSGGFGIQSMAPVFFKVGSSSILSLNFVTIMFAFLFVDMFGTLGTLVGVAPKADMLDKDGKFLKIRGALLSDVIGTSLGAVFGISTITTFVESVSGVAGGGRTGLISVVAAVFFDLSLSLPPVFLTIPSFATAPALIIVGFLMISSVLKTDFNDLTETTLNYIAIIAMSFMYSISEGTAMGVISYVVTNVATGYAKDKETSLLMYVLAVLSAPEYALI